MDNTSGRNKTDETEERFDSINRRNIIKSIGATSAVAGGFTQLAGAQGGSGNQSEDRETVRRLTEKYQSKRSIEHVLNKHADGLTSELVAQGLIDTNEIVPEPLLGHGKYSRTVSNPESDTNTGANVGINKVDGEFTAHISISKNMEEGRLVVFVEPEIDQAHAVVYSNENEVERIIFSQSHELSSYQSEPDPTTIEPKGLGCGESCKICYPLQQCGWWFGSAYKRRCCTVRGEEVDCYETEPCGCC